MIIFLPNNIANFYDVDSTIFKKDYKKNTCILMKVTSVSYYGFKLKDTHVKFTGYILSKKPLR